MNSDFFMVFILAHIFGDFVFQSGKIAKLKSQETKGVIYHSLIVLAFQVVFLSVFGVKGIFAALISGALHFGIDYCKRLVGKYFEKSSVLLFFGDQALHFLVIAALQRLLKPESVFSQETVFLMKGTIILVALAFVNALVAKMLLRDLFANIRQNSFFYKWERIRDAVFSLLFFLSFWKLDVPASLGVVSLLGAAYLWNQKTRYPYGYAALGIKLACCLTLSYVGSVLLIA